MAEMNRFLRMCLLSFAALTVSMGTANGQTRDSARISLSHRTLDGLATTFNDYAGFAYTAADLQQLQEQSSLLESSGHQAFLKVAHIVLSPYGQINEELEGQALSKLLGDKELLFYVYFASADLPRPAFSVAVVNSDMTEDEISGMEEYLAAAMQSHSEGGASMPDVLAHGIKLYQMMAASDLSFEYRAAGLNLAAPELVYKLEKDMQFVAVSGVPIKLPAGSRAYFYSRSEDSTRIGMLKSFKLPGSNVEERPFYWKSGAHEGKFAGYGHWQEALDTAAWVKFYSYEGFLVEDEDLPHCNAPPYDLGEIVTVTLGFPMPCGLNQLAKLDLHSRLYEVSWADLSLPGSDGVQGNTGNGPPPPYRAANEARTIYEVKEQVRPGLAIFEMDCSQEVQSADYLPPLAPFPCGLENVLPASVLLEKGDSTCAVAYLPDGTIAMAFIYKQRLHLAYEYYAGEILVVRYLAEHDIWEYVNIDGDSFLAHAGIVLGWAGEMVATAAPFVLLAANFAVGAGASALGFSARALFLIDLGMSAVDAGLVYALTDDAQQAVQAFAVGVLTVGTGILVHKAIKAYKADKLNAVLRFQKVKSNGELGEAIKVDLASYRNVLRSKGWGDAKINKLFDDMAESEGLARYLLSDLERARAWKKLDDLGFATDARRNVTNIRQRSLIDEYADVISNESNARKGNFGEIGADLDLNAKGYTSLQPRITDIDWPGHDGIDIVAKKNGQYFIVEGKYSGSASLNPANPATGLPKQMSDDWISQNDYARLRDAIGDDLADQVRDIGFTKILAKTSPDGSVSYKLLDSDASIIGTWIP